MPEHRKDRVVKAHGRSRVSNGKQLFLDPNIDQRTATARRYRDVLAELIAQYGGVDALSEAEVILARRAATLVIICEREESRLAAGLKIDVISYLQTVNALKRVLETLGTKRRPKEVQAAALHDYVAANAAQGGRTTIEGDAEPSRRINEAVAAVASGPFATEAVPAPRAQRVQRARPAGERRPDSPLGLPA